MLSSRSSRAVRFASGTPLGARDAPSPRPSGWAPTPSTRGATPSSIRQGFAASTPLTTGNMMSAQGAQHGRTGSTPSNRLTATPKAAGARNAPENTSAVKVAVRVRPFSSTERADRCRSVVRMQNQSTYLIDPSGIGEPDEDLYTREFCYDYSYWSFDKADDNYASQDSIFQDLGMFVLENAFKGYNCSVFAYGQTGAGKSYTMMGTGAVLSAKLGDAMGLIPRICRALFERAASNTENSKDTVEVSYLEIYNERVRDLFNPDLKPNGKAGNGKRASLKIRAHPKKGVYVENLSSMAVCSYEEIERLLVRGSKARTVASTNMNDASSRSHAVFQIVFRQFQIDDSEEGAKSGKAQNRARSGSTKRQERRKETVSKICLVDLAGSERTEFIDAAKGRLRETANINKSLSTLGDVIKALSTRSQKPNSQKPDAFVPYRNSVLTWLLKESLGGNSKTVMIAAISPADMHYEQTLSTLKYIERAKKIVNNVTINENSDVILVHHLQREIFDLKRELERTSMLDAEVTKLREELEEREKLIQQLVMPWEQRVEQTRQLEATQEASLKNMGVVLSPRDVYENSGNPFLINLNQDPLFSETVIYPLVEKQTRFGRGDSPVEQHVKLNGPNILPEHCVIEIGDDEVSIFTAPGALAFVNGFNISESLEPTPICNGDRIILGSNHYFRFHYPAAAGSPMRGAGGSDTDSFGDDGDGRHTWEEAHAEAVAALQDALGEKADVLDPNPPSSNGISPGSGSVVPVEELALVQQQLQGSMHESQQLKRKLERQISEDIEVMEKQRQEYEFSAQTIEAKLNQAQARSKQLLREKTELLQQLQEEKQSAERALDDKDEQISQLKDANNRLRERMQQSEHKRASLKSKFKASLQAAVKRQNDEALASLKSQLLSKYQMELEQALAAQAARNAEAKVEDAATTEDVAAEVSQLKSQVEHQDKQKKALRQKYRDLKADMQVLQQQLEAALTGNVDANSFAGNSRTSAINSQNQQLLVQLADLADRVKSEQVSRHRYEEENEELQKQVKRLKMQLASDRDAMNTGGRSSIASRLQADLEQSEKEKALLQAKHRALKAQTAEAAREAAEREGQAAATLDSFVESQRKLQTDLEERQRTIRMQSKTLQTMQAENKLLSNQLEALQHHAGSHAATPGRGGSDSKHQLEAQLVQLVRDLGGPQFRNFRPASSGALVEAVKAVTAIANNGSDGSIDTLRQRLSAHEREIETLKSKEKALYQRLQATEKSRRELRRRVNMVESVRGSE